MLKKCIKGHVTLCNAYGVFDVEHRNIIVSTMCIQFELNIMICSTISLTFSTPNVAFLTPCKWLLFFFFFFFGSLILFHGVWSILCCSLVLTQLDLQIRERHFGMHVRGTQSVLFLKKNNH